MSIGHKICLNKDGKPTIRKMMDLDTMYKDLAEYIEYLESTNRELGDKLYNYDKESEVQKYKDELMNVRRDSLYILSDEEKELIYNFRKEHYKKCGKSSRIKYILSPTEIGTGINIQCSCCGEKKDISNYGNW